uniref:Metalloendopeptidase OMA1, mitochondrial n=1 Tax=Timema monikensis TaxID=170555 RepID=A0A7R9EF82_9NEOP|nr:unnamed protein product [Timema monikensis]
MFNFLLLKKCSNHCRYFELLIKKCSAHHKYTLQLDKKYVVDLTNNKCKLTSCNYNQSFMHSASSMLPLKSHPNNLSYLYLFSKFASHLQSQQSQALHTIGFLSLFKSPQKIKSCNGIAHPLVTQPFRSLHTPVKESSVWVYFMILIRPLSKVVAIVFGRSFRKWWKSLPPNKRKLFMESLQKNKYKILFFTSVLTGLSYYFYYSHLEENPLTRKQRFILFTQDQIMQLADIELEAQMMLFGDKILNPSHPVYKRVSRVAHAIIKASKDMKGIPNMKWSITVINDPDVRNAFVLPDGKMFIFTGMIAECSNDDQLAIIMTHEMAHALLSHMTLLEAGETGPTEENIREWLNGENGGPGYQIQTGEKIAPDVLSPTTTNQNTDEEELQPLSKSKLSSAREALYILIGVIDLTSDPELQPFYRHFRTACEIICWGAKSVPTLGKAEPIAAFDAEFQGVGNLFKSASVEKLAKTTSFEIKNYLQNYAHSNIPTFAVILARRNSTPHINTAVATHLAHGKQDGERLVSSVVECRSGREKDREATLPQSAHDDMRYIIPGTAHTLPLYHDSIRHQRQVSDDQASSSPM